LYIQYCLLYHMLHSIWASYAYHHPSCLNCGPVHVKMLMEQQFHYDNQLLVLCQQHNLYTWMRNMIFLNHHPSQGHCKITMATRSSLFTTNINTIAKFWFGYSLIRNGRYCSKLSKYTSGLLTASIGFWISHVITPSSSIFILSWE